MIRVFKNPRFRSILAAIVAIAFYKAISALTGFGAWADANPIARAVGHLFGILLFGGFGIFALLGGRFDPEMRTIFFRLVGILFLLFAAIHAGLLFGFVPSFIPE